MKPKIKKTLINPYLNAIDGSGTEDFKLYEKTYEVDPHFPGDLLLEFIDPDGHKGVLVYKVNNKHFLYVKDGIILTERAGATPESIELVVNLFWDGMQGEDSLYSVYRSCARMVDAYKKGLHIKGQFLIYDKF